jgi:hypothetical protein
VLRARDSGWNAWVGGNRVNPVVVGSSWLSSSSWRRSIDLCKPWILSSIDSSIPYRIRFPARCPLHLVFLCSSSLVFLSIPNKGIQSHSSLADFF